MIFPEFEGVGIYQLEKLAALGDTGTPQLLTSGLGSVLGYWCITGLNKTEAKHMQAGIPIKQVYSLEIIYYGDSISN